MSELDLVLVAGQVVEFATHNPELTLGIFGAGLLGMAFSIGQKHWLRQALGNKCAAEEIGMKGKHGGGLELHHRVPQLYAYTLLGLTEEQVDSPYNAALICHEHHVGETTDVIHPDQRYALEDFRKGNKDAFRVLQDMRRNQVEVGEEYWDTTWDTRMAAYNTNRINSFVKKFKLPFPHHLHRGIK